MTTIPASELVAVSPSVLGAGGNGVDVICLFLTTSTRVPIGQVLSFPDGESVSNFFGPASIEAQVANGGPNYGNGYFGGFDGSAKQPGSILFVQYNQAAVAAYLRGGDIAAVLSLAQLQALSGSLNIVVDGYLHSISSIVLSSYNSFSAAAAGIQAAFDDPVESTFTASLGAAFTASGTGTNLTVTAVTGLISIGDTAIGTGIPASTTIVSQTSGTTGGAGLYVTSQATTASTASCTSTSTVLDVTVNTDLDIAVGQTLVGSGVAGTPLITAQLSGTTGSIGTYRISGAQQHVVSESMTGIATAPLVTFDSVSGAFIITSGITGTPSTVAFATGTLAAPLLLTSATGAVLSQGAAAAVPAGFMNSVVIANSNWVNFATAFDPDNGSGNSVKLAFSAWKNSQNNRFGYICWDLDITPTAAMPATSSLGYILANNNDSGTCLLEGDPAVGWNLNTAVAEAAFIAGAAASIDFTRTRGRISFAYKAQAGLLATVQDPTIAANLGGNPQVNGSRGNGYNFYGAYGNANANFIWFQRGFVTGDFAWFDSYINQIWMNNAFQNALLNLQKNALSIPYSTDGNALIEAAMADPIQAALNFGACGPGVLSASQVAQVNARAGLNIASVLQTQGYYLQILPAPAATRAGRTSPPCTFWYIDQGSVQAISLSSIALS